MSTGAAGRLLRSRTVAGGARVSQFELLFDLVYVFAVTQISHLLLAHLSPLGALQSVMMLLAIWWAWVYTTWATNWLDPDQSAVRFMLVGVMLGSLLMSSAIPEAFGDRGLLFAASYAAIQAGRSAFVVWATRSDPVRQRNFQRILTWNLLGGVVWIVGGLAPPENRELIWLAALAIDYAAPALGFVVPGLGKSVTTEWTIAGGHIAERFQLFIILAIGESILITGSTFGDLPDTPPFFAALLVAFLGSVALWWIYFVGGGLRAEHAISGASDPGRIARSAYTYAHLPMVAGIIATAVGDELVLAHPEDHPAAFELLVLVAAPILFLVGHFLFRWFAFRLISWPHLVVIATIVVIGAVGSQLPLLLFSALTTAAMIVAAGWTARVDQRRANAGP